jgi:hypothetical protein
MKVLKALKGFGAMNSCPRNGAGLCDSFSMSFGQHLHGQETSIHNQNTAPRFSMGYR